MNDIVNDHSSDSDEIVNNLKEAKDDNIKVLEGKVDSLTTEKDKQNGQIDIFKRVMLAVSNRIKMFEGQC